MESVTQAGTDDVVVKTFVVGLRPVIGEVEVVAGHFTTGDVVVAVTNVEFERLRQVIGDTCVESVGKAPVAIEFTVHRRRGGAVA